MAIHLRHAARHLLPSQAFFTVSCDDLPPSNAATLKTPFCMRVIVDHQASVSALQGVAAVKLSSFGGWQLKATNAFTGTLGADSIFLESSC